MDKKDTFIKYSPLAIVIISIILQWNLFVTPEKLEIKHREILQHVSETYGTKEDLADMRKKIDKIYDIIVLREK